MLRRQQATAIRAMPSPINNVEGYLEALRTFQVDEVSDNLFINFPTPPYLYPESLPLGWVGGSHNLHQLLVLNQRYQDDVKTISKGEVQISDKSFAALFRNIGFPAGANPEDFGTSFFVYDRKSTTKRSPTTNEGIELSYAANIQLPTIQGFEQFFSRDLIRYGGLLPSKVASYQQQLDATWSSIQDDVFSDSWRRGNTLSMYLEYLGVQPKLALTYETANAVAGNPVTGDGGIASPDFFVDNEKANSFAQLINPGDPDDTFVEGGEKLYEWWVCLSKAYGDLIFNNGQVNRPPTDFFQTTPKNDQDIRNCIGINKTTNEPYTFSELIQDLLETQKNNPKANYRGFGKIEDILAATLRFHYQFNYQAFSLNTQNSLPYANAANPFVIGSFEQLNSQDWGDQTTAPVSWKSTFGDTWFDTFSGNEEWVNNLKLDSLTTGEISAPQNQDKKAQDAQKKLYNTLSEDGWFSLNAETYKAVTERTNGDTKYGYETIFYFDANSSPASQAVVFDRDTNSSDTLTATYLDQSSFNINPKTKLKDGTRIKDLGGLVKSDGVLPDSFRSYISLSGGVDRVTGSSYADVIVGTTVDDHGNVTPGSLNAIAGAGADVVAPGRGSGSIQLGLGRDKLVIDEHDTLGRTTLFDFTFGEDELVIHPNLSLAVSVNNNSLLYVFTPGTNQGDDLKTLHLTQASSGADGAGWTDYFNHFADQSLIDALTEQPPGLI